MGATIGGSVSRITAEHVDDLATGSAVLGCGGGGDVDLIVPALRGRGPRLSVPVRSPDDDLHAFVAVTYLGSTMVLGEKPPGGSELPSAVAAVEKWSGRSADAVMPAQVGGLTTLGATLLADMIGLPLLDADLVGRTTPRLDQFSVFARRRPEVVASAVTSSGLVVTVDARSPAELEAALRGAIARSGGWAALAIGPLSLGELRKDIILGSVSRAVSVGEALSDRGVSLECAARRADGVIAAGGRVLDVERHDDPLTFVHGSVSMVDTGSGAVSTLEMGSEFLYLVVDGEPRAAVPDIISVLDARTHAALSTDDLRPGIEISVLVLPAAPLWRSSDAFLRRADPRFYGIDADALPAETS